MQASMPLVVWYSTFSSQVSELVCLMAETFRAKGLAIAKDSSKCKKKKVRKFVLDHADNGKTPLVLNLVARWWKVVNFKPWPRYHRGKPLVPTE